MFKSTDSTLWLGKAKDKEVINMYKTHLGKILKTVEKMDEAVKTFCNNGGSEEIDRISENVWDSEREADKVKEDIYEELSKGVLQPINREAIMRLIRTSDGIADNAKGGAMKLSFLNPESVGEDVKSSLKKLSKFACQATVILNDAFLATLENPESVREEMSKVERKEEEVDTFRGEELIPQIVEWADEVDNPGTSYIIAKVEGNIEDVVDHSENCADVIRELAIVSL